jgi:Tfp pilus assembly PilM family ATPase
VAQRFLALDWDQQQLHLVAAMAGGGTVRFQRALALAEQSSPNPAEAPELGRLLRERLKAAAIAPAPVLACVGRDRIILKEVRYPNVPPHEEPAVVRFQAVKELTDAADDVVIDYFPLGASASGEKRAQVLIVRRELLNTYQTLCQAAGLRLAGLTPRPFGSAACLQKLLAGGGLTPPEPADAAVALVTVGERWAEFCIVKDGQLLQARALTLGPGLAGEIRRNLAVHAGQSPQNPVRAVYLALSGEQAALRERLVELLDIPVHPFDPFAGAEQPELPAAGRGTFIGAVGLLHLRARSAELPVNFALAKQPKPPRDPNRRLYLLGACAAVLLLLGGLVFGQKLVSNAEEELEEAKETTENLNAQLVKERLNTTRMKALHEWDGVPWPDELYELTARMPEIQPQFKVRSLEGNVERTPSRSRARQAAPGITPADRQELDGRPIARFHLKLDSPNDDKLNDLTANLLQAAPEDGVSFYRPEPHKRSRGGLYDKDIYIRKRPPADYTKPIAVPAGRRADNR